MRPRLTPWILAALALFSWNPPVNAGGLLETGMPFPAFSLKNDHGELVRSDSLRGTYFLVYFYPKADTPGCTKEACAFRDAWPEVQSEGLVVLGVSFDTPRANRAFAEKFHLPFPLLSDTDKKLAAQVGAKRFLIPYPRRISYLVGPDGTVLAVYRKVDPSTHAAEVLRDLRRLRAGAGPESDQQPRG